LYVSIEFSHNRSSISGENLALELRGILSTKKKKKKKERKEKKKNAKYLLNNFYFWCALK